MEKKGDIVKSGDIIAKSGVSGIVGGTCAPHLHFEIFSIGNAIGKDLKYRINPGFFINFKNFNTMSEEERNLQQDTAKAGKILNFKGSD